MIFHVNFAQIIYYISTVTLHLIQILMSPLCSSRSLCIKVCDCYDQNTLHIFHILFSLIHILYLPIHSNTSDVYCAYTSLLHLPKHSNTSH